LQPKIDDHRAAAAGTTTLDHSVGDEVIESLALAYGFYCNSQNSTIDSN